jgi:nitroreductase
MSEHTEFFEVVKQRRSIRRFRLDEVPSGVIEDIMQIAALSASSRHTERYRVLVVSNRETIERMKAACIETIERRSEAWTDADEADWSQLNIPFPKRDRIGESQRDHYRYFSVRFDTFFGDAPIVAVMATQPLVWKAAPHVWPTLQLIGATMQTVALAAVGKGIGSCCMTGPLHSRDAHRQILGLKPPWEIVALMPLGISAYEPAPRPRKPVAEVLRWLNPSGPTGESATNADIESAVAPIKVKLSEAVRNRRNVYRFGPDPVPQDEIREIIRLATLAPNSLNQQKWQFVAITDRNVLKRLRDVVVQTAADIVRRSKDEAQAVFEDWAFLDAPEFQLSDNPRAWSDFVASRASCLAEAPTVVAVLNEAVPHGPTGAGWSDIESIGSVVETLMLAATARGYGTCWMTSPLVAWPQVDRIVGARDPWRSVALVPLGLPREKTAQCPDAMSKVFTWVK